MTNTITNKMNLQQASDYAVSKILEQGTRCLGDNQEWVNMSPTCAYGNENGEHCVIGWLLDSNDINLMSYEGSIKDMLDAHMVEVLDVVTESGVISLDNLDTLVELQNFHDARLQADRASCLTRLSSLIDTRGSQYQQWVELGE